MMRLQIENPVLRMSAGLGVVLSAVAAFWGMMYGTGYFVRWVLYNTVWTDPNADYNSIFAAFGAGSKGLVPLHSIGANTFTGLAVLSAISLIITVAALVYVVSKVLFSPNKEKGPDRTE